MAKQPSVTTAAVSSVHHKTCGKCKQSLPLSSFAPRSGRPGLRAQCRKCRSKENAAWAKANPERVKASNRASDKKLRAARRTPRVKKLFAQRAALSQIPDSTFVSWLKKMVATKRKKSEGALTAAWVSQWQHVTHCAVTGLPFVAPGSRLANSPHPQSPSLDRIDSAKGYTPQNTRVVSFFANVAKSSWPEDYFKLLVMAAASNMRH